MEDKIRKYNTNFLVGLEINDLTVPSYYQYIPEKKGWFGKVTPAHVYSRWLYYSSVEPPKHHVIKDGGIWLKPEVTLVYVDNIYKNYYFNTLEEAKDFASMFTIGDNWID